MMCLIWIDHVNKLTAKNDGMINIFCNDKECFKRNPSLKIEASVFPTIYNFELLAAEFFRGIL
jgi:hypothetical protein